MKKIATTTERTGAVGGPSITAPTWGIVGALLIALAALLALVGFASPASAASSYPPAPSCAVAGTSTGSGSTITGTGFRPGSPVSVSLGGSHEVVVTNSAGSFATSLGASSGQLTATGSGCVAQARISALAAQAPNLVPASNRSGGALPNTGADVLGVLVVAGLMVAGGVLLLVQGRRKHS
jgi:LPXTG-motif cell wall-anchored protein